MLEHFHYSPKTRLPKNPTNLGHDPSNPSPGNARPASVSRDLPVLALPHKDSVILVLLGLASSLSIAPLVLCVW